MQEFINEVVSGLKERLTDCEIMATTKDLPNGLARAGVVIKPNGMSVAPMIYLDEFYKSNLPVRDTIDAVVKIFEEHKSPDIDMSWFSDFEQVRPLLRARLYNKSTKAEIFRSASEYGFDDLIIVPYVNVSMSNSESGSVKVTKRHLDGWGVSSGEVIDIALGNVAKLGKITDLVDIISGRTGMPKEMFDDNGFMKVINIIENCGLYGAISVVTCRSQLREMFPGGYYVIPSSIHECIVVPMIEEADIKELTEMVKIVNAEEVAPEDILSDHVYEVAG